jgi:2-C-methyl-D-erythritol 2,4-cyclodiphosphate synthase
MKFAPVMRETMGAILEIAADDISIKATTTEKMGFVGRGEGLVAYATVLIEQ